MSFVSVRIRHLDQQLERLIPSAAPSPIRSPTSPTSLFARDATAEQQRFDHGSEYVKRLQNAIQTIDSYGSANSKIEGDTLLAILSRAQVVPDIEDAIAAKAAKYSVARTALEQELEWAFLGKLVIHTYGLLLETLLAQTLPLSEDLRYWEEVRASYYWTMMYWIESSPVRLIGYAKEVVGESLKRLRELGKQGGLSGVVSGRNEDVSELDIAAQRGGVDSTKEKGKGMVEELKRFYGLVRNTIEERSRKFQHSVLIQTPVAMARREISNKRGHIKNLRETQAAALGILVGESLVFESENDTREDWKEMIKRSVGMMDNITRCAGAHDVSVQDFEVFAFEQGQVTVGIKGIEVVERQNLDSTIALSLQLRDILKRQLPLQAKSAAAVVATHGRPSWVIRNWIPITAVLLSSSTILKYIVNRQAELKEWIREMGETTIDFWVNWVVDPLKRIIGTIRHDKDSEVALMSRRSLNSDMESLERMVVDFAIDNPSVSLAADEPVASYLTQEQLDVIRRHVKEGDLTPVLRAYEQDLKRPFVGAVRGELVRALLIQIQKTKVDVEVAISGIDSLLKSQELLFGILGLMPSTLICVGTLRWFRGTWGGRRGLKSSKLSQEMLRSLRHIDRILSEANPEDNGGTLPFKDHGLLLCEVYLLQEYSKLVLPKDIRGDFTEEMEGLMDIRKGIKRQRRIVKRVRWAFKRWIH